jgi:outer membrane protein OmpA-like peptidoglycan-associated protein
MAPAATVPTAPLHLSAVGTTGELELTFTTPTSNGGATITSYQYSLDGGKTWHTIATAAGAKGVRTATIRGLENGVSYSVLVRAVNRVGAGARSVAAHATTNPPWKGTPSTKGEITVPKHPADYHGTRKYTKDRFKTYGGHTAHTVAELGAHQMTVGDAITTDGSQLFGFNSAVLTKQGRAVVRLIATHLKLAHAIVCEGYSDYAADANHELKLSASRARAVCRALVADGVHVTFVSHGYGRARPVVVGGSAQSRAANRRVVIRVTK